MDKKITLQQAMDLINDGDTLLVGGFGLSGTPLSLLDEIAKSEKKI